MTNPYYVPTGTPGTGSAGNSAPMRSEFQLIAGGFDRFPNFNTSVPGAPVIINSLGNGLTTAQNVTYGNGSIGLGTPASPTASIDILKNQNDTTKIRITNTDPGTLASTEFLMVNGAHGAGWVFTGTGYVSQVSPAAYDRTDGAYFLTDGAGGCNFACSNAVGSFRFFLGSNLSYVQMSLDYDGILRAKGPVQVGAPGVQGDIRVSRPSDGAMVARMYALPSPGDGLGFEAGGASPIVFYTTTASLGVSSVERMRIAPDGTITTGHGPVILGDTTKNGEIQFKREDGYAASRIWELTGGAGLGIESSGGGSYIAFFASSSGLGNNAERMRITSDGNVGIGEQTGPIYSLDILVNKNQYSGMRATNYSSGNAAYAACIVSNSTANMYMTITGTNYAATNAVDTPNVGTIQCGASNGLKINTLNPTPIMFFTGYVERVRFDTNGNVGIGSSSPNSKLHISGNTNAGVGIAAQNVNSGGSAYADIRLVNDLGSLIDIYITSSGYTPGGQDFSQQGVFYCNTNGMLFHNATPFPIRFAIQGTEWLRINPDGHVMINTGAAGSAFLQVAQTLPSHTTATFRNANASPNGSVVQEWRYDSAAPNGSNNYFLGCYDTATYRMFVYSNGGIANYQSNDVNLSCDASIKTDITRYDDSDLDGLEASFRSVDWGKFKFLDQTHNDWNYGYTAQGIERAFSNSAPELVEEFENEGKRRKGIYSADLDHIAHALLARVLKEKEEMKIRISELEAKLNG